MSIMEFPAALSNLLEILSSPNDLDTFIFLKTLDNSTLVEFRNSKTFLPGVT